MSTWTSGRYISPRFALHGGRDRLISVGRTSASVIRTADYSSLPSIWRASRLLFPRTPIRAGWKFRQLAPSPCPRRRATYSRTVLWHGKVGTHQTVLPLSRRNDRRLERNFVTLPLLGPMPIELLSELSAARQRAHCVHQNAGIASRQPSHGAVQNHPRHHPILIALFRNKETYRARHSACCYPSGPRQKEPCSAPNRHLRW